MTRTPCYFETDRLVVEQWHSALPDDDDLAGTVALILTPPVTHSLPSGWQGEYSQQRAAEWIRERDQESTCLLIMDRETASAIGLLIASEAYEETPGREVRIGYLLSESAWGRGIGTELLRGFTDWCATAGIASIVGGVERDNHASRRVMEKAGFVVAAGDAGDSELFYRFDLN